MATRPRAKRVQNPWQDIEQNQTEGRGRFDRNGSDQPKPRVGCRQTAQSVPRGCQSRRRSSAVMGVDLDMGHAALRSGPAAVSISCRMARLLKPKVISAEAR
jgi:hypothetical protein